MIKKNFLLCLFIAAISLIAGAAQELNQRPLNILLLSHYGDDNGAVRHHIEDGLTDYNPCFVILFNSSLLARRDVIDTMEGNFKYPGSSSCPLFGSCFFESGLRNPLINWKYYFNAKNEFVMCVPKDEERTLAALGFVEADWHGPVSMNEVRTHQCVCVAKPFVSCFENLFCKNSTRPPLQVSLSGHGTSCEDISSDASGESLQFKGGSIAGMAIQEYQKFLHCLTRLGTQHLSLETCFGGGRSLLASVNAGYKPSFPIVVHSIGDAVSYADSSVNLGRLFSQLTTMLNKECPSHDIRQELTQVLKKSYNKSPSIENIPLVYVPGQKFFEPVAISNEVIIGHACQAAVEIPQGCRVTLLQNPCFEGCILDKINTVRVPLVSKIPGNATHIIGSVSNVQVPMRYLLQSFLPTQYCRLQDTKFQAIKLWLIHNLSASDGTLEQCALFFDGITSTLFLLAKFPSSYGMIKLPVKTTCDPLSALDKIIELSPPEYICLVRHFCQKAQIHTAVAQAMNLQNMTPSVMSDLFLQKQGFSNADGQEAMAVDGVALLDKNLVCDVMSIVYSIKHFEEFQQYHDLWRAYYGLASMQYVPDVERILPTCLKICLKENMEQQALFIAYKLMDREQRENIKPYAEQVGSVAGRNLLNMLSGTQDQAPKEVGTPLAVGPWRLLHKVVETSAEKQLFSQGIAQLKTEKKYEKIFTILSFLIPDSEKLVSADNFILGLSTTLRERRSLIVQAIEEDPEMCRAFVNTVTAWFNIVRPHDGLMERKKAKLLIKFLFSNGEYVASLSKKLLVDIIEGIQGQSLRQEADYFEDLGSRYIEYGNTWLPVAGLIAQKLAHNNGGARLSGKLPFSYKPLEYRLACNKAGTQAEESLVLNDFSIALHESPDEAIEILLRTIPYGYIDGGRCKSGAFESRITSLVKILLNSSDFKGIVVRFVEHATNACKRDRARSILTVMRGQATSEYKEYIEKNLKSIPSFS